MKIEIAALALVAALAGGGTIADASADDAFLSHFVGTWVGRGTMQISPSAKPERVYCKISNALSEDGNSLVQSGRCSLASNSGAINGAFTALGGGEYSGTLDTFASRGPATLSGTLHGATLTMLSKYTDKLSGLPVQATNTLALISGGYTLTATRADPESGSTYTSSKIVFTEK